MITSMPTANARARSSGSTAALICWKRPTTSCVRTFAAERDVTANRCFAQRVALGLNPQVEEARDLRGAHLREPEVTLHEPLQRGAPCTLDCARQLHVPFVHTNRCLQAPVRPPT